MFLFDDEPTAVGSAAAVPRFNYSHPAFSWSSSSLTLALSPCSHTPGSAHSFTSSPKEVLDHISFCPQEPGIAAGQLCS